MGRRTTTGAVFENSIALALQHGGFETHFQRNIGLRPGGGKHIVDILAVKGNEKVLVSLKWQQSSGTAEQKVPYEFICLAQALSQEPKFTRAYLVLGGNGWTKRDFFIEELSSWIKHRGPHPVIIEGNDFIALANKGIW